MMMGLGKHNEENNKANIITRCLAKCPVEKTSSAHPMVCIVPKEKYQPEISCKIRSPHSPLPSITP